MSTEIYRSPVVYLMKPIKDCIFRLVDRLKGQINSSVNVPPFTCNIKERLGHAAGFQEMDQTQTQNNDTDHNHYDINDDLAFALSLELGNQTNAFEFVGVEDGTTEQAQNQSIESNWDLDIVGNDDSAVPDLDPFPLDSIPNNEQNDSNVDHLSAESEPNEVGEYTVVAEQCLNDDSVDTLRSLKPTRFKIRKRQNQYASKSQILKSSVSQRLQAEIVANAKGLLSTVPPIPTELCDNKNLELYTVSQDNIYDDFQ